MGTGIKIKTQLICIGKSQRWLVEQLRQRGFTTLTDSLLSSILSGSYNRGCAFEILAAAEKILEEMK